MKTFRGLIAMRLKMKVSCVVNTALGLLGLWSTANAALAAERAPPLATVISPVTPTEAETALSLDEAAALSLRDQPVLIGREALISADERQAVSAAQLPDPKLSGGLKELPVDTSEAFSVRRDNFTEFTMGLSQELPRTAKRRLKGERKQLDADTERAALANDRRAIRRAVSLAWLDVYEAEQALRLAHQLTAEALLQVQSLEKDYSAGKASQADWSAAKVEAGLTQDKEHDWRHHVERSRAMLERWIGDDAARPLTDSPSLPALPGTLPALLLTVDQHPTIRGLGTQIDASTNDIALARQAYKPDVSVEGYVAYRPGFSDFVGVQVSVGLPYFTRNRQDPEMAAAFERSRANKERKRDLERELRAQVTQSYIDWQHYRARVGEFDTLILPGAARRIEEARAAYQAGRGGFDAVLAARRSLLDIETQRLSLSMEAARAQVRLEYFAAPRERPGEAP